MADAMTDEEWNQALDVVAKAIGEKRGFTKAAAAVNALRALDWCSPEEVRARCSEAASEAMDEG